jgi:hypothetical protein
MTEYAVVPATLEHIQELAVTMRQADRDEVIAQTGSHPSIVLGMTFGSADVAWAGLVDGAVACVFGVCPSDHMSSEIGVPWLIGSDLIVQHQKRFLRENKKYVGEMHDLYPILENYVDYRNTVAIRWLKWLGFDILATEPHGPFKMPFHPFRRVRV